MKQCTHQFIEWRSEDGILKQKTSDVQCVVRLMATKVMVECLITRSLWITLLLLLTLTLRLAYSVFFLFISDCSHRSVCWTRSILIFLLCCDCHFDSFQFLSTSMHALLPPDTFTTTPRHVRQGKMSSNETKKKGNRPSYGCQIIERRRETIVFSIAYDAVHSHEYVLWFRICGNGKNGYRFGTESLTEPWQWQQHRHSSSNLTSTAGWLDQTCAGSHYIRTEYWINNCAQSISIFPSRRL